MDATWYTSIAGIAAAAFFGAEATKRYLAEQHGWNRVPLVAYVMTYAAVGTLIGRYVMGTLDGDPWQLLVKSLTAALLAVGARSAWVNSGKPLSESGSPRPNSDGGWPPIPGPLPPPPPPPPSPSTSDPGREIREGWQKQ